MGFLLLRRGPVEPDQLREAPESLRIDRDRSRERNLGMPAECRVRVEPGDSEDSALVGEAREHLATDGADGEVRWPRPADDEEERVPFHGD